MKILIISKYYLPKTGARSLQMSKVINALITHQKCQIHVIAGYEKEKPSVGFPYPVEYIKIPESISCKKNNIFTKLLDKLKALHCYFSWINNATIAGKKIIKDFEPDIILSASVPPDSNLVGLKLCKYSKIPWAAFFSDIEPAYFAPGQYKVKTPLFCGLPYKPFPFYIVMKIRKILKTANAVLLTNRIAGTFMQQINHVDFSSRLHIVNPIGDMPQNPNNVASTKPTISPDIELSRSICHIGLLDHPRLCLELISAVKNINQKYPGKLNKFIFIGNVCEEMLIAFRKAAPSLFIHIPHVPFDTINYYTSRATALLIIEADITTSPYLPSKLAEYALSQKPVLAITPQKSAIRDIAQQHNEIRCVTRNTEQIEKAIMDLLSHEIKPSNSLANIFSSKFVSGQYMNIFNQIIKQPMSIQKKHENS